MVLIMRSDNMKEFKSTDVILNTIYEEYTRDRSKYECVYINGVLMGSLIYSYATDKISHSEFIELLQILRGEITECIQ